MGIYVTSRVTLDPTVQAFVRATSEPAMFAGISLQRGRLAVEQLQAGEVFKPDVQVDDLAIPGGPFGQVPVRVMRPRHAVGLLPAIVYIHGSGWVFGSVNTHDRLVRELVARTGAAVVFPNYSLSPEARYPVAVEECYAVLRWLADHGAEIALDGFRLAIAGDCVGGNMAAAITLLAKYRCGPAIAAQALLYPVTDAGFETDSYDAFAEGYFLRRQTMEWFWDQYVGRDHEREEITVSPLRADADQLIGLPKALVITAEADVVRDEGEAYADRLQDANVDVTLTRYAGMIHDFMMLNALRQTHAAAAAIDQTATFLREALR